MSSTPYWFNYSILRLKVLLNNAYSGNPEDELDEETIEAIEKRIEFLEFQRDEANDAKRKSL